MLGENIKKERKKLALTQDQLADKMSVTRQTVSKWELEQVNPDIDTLIKLADLFEISLDELVRGEKYKVNALQLEDKKSTVWSEIKSINWWVVGIFLIVLIASLKAVIFD